MSDASTGARAGKARGWQEWLLLVGLLGWLSWGLSAPTVVSAQGPLPTPAPIDWQEQRTASFAILYPAGEGAEATRYATFMDDVYNDLTRFLDHSIQTPITLRLYATLADYEQVNPFARQSTGILAHAQPTRREMAVLVPRTVNLSDEEIVNNIRHEVTHLIAGDLSNQRLPAGFQEGIAQYMERPGRQLEEKVRLLQAADAGGRLLSWAELNTGTTIYEQPDIGYPQTASIVAFLIDRYGFPRFRTFMEAFGEAAGYRSALQEAYGIPADRLEESWREWLPDYFAGRWRVNAVWAYDIAPLEKLVTEGAYSMAESEIDAAIALISATDQVQTLARLLELRDQVRTGRSASDAVQAAREALGQGDYPAAVAQIATARQSFAAIGDQRHTTELAELEAWAERGERGLATLQEAQAAAARLDHEGARTLALEAATVLGELGHPDGPAQARAIVTTIDRREQTTALGLLMTGLMALFGNVLWRWHDARRLRLAGGAL